MKKGIVLENVTKSFNGVEVLHPSSLHFEYGRVHALIGENGAGKSTTMKIIAGIQKPTSGKVFKDEREIVEFTPKKASENKIAIIHQELSYVSELTVAENIFLGKEPRKYGFIDYKLMAKKANTLFSSLGIAIDPKERMGNLRQANKQLVEIAKAVAFDAEVIIMDEPTSSLSHHETEKLFQIMHTLVWQEKCIIFISHKLDEVYKIADTISVMRDGEVIGTWSARKLDRDKLIYHMVGRTLDNIYPQRQAVIGEPFFEVRELTRKNEFSNISFSVRKGEVLGVAGLVGAGRTETMQTIFGLRKKECGEVFLDGKKLYIKTPKNAVEEGISYVPEDRKEMGLVLIQSVGRNLSLPSLTDIQKGCLGIDASKEKELIDKQIEAMSIKTDSSEKKVSRLSGGNQQKVVLGKWIAKNPKVLILDEPTKGVDQGAKYEIYSIMNKYVLEGRSIIMISSDMPELIGMADRIIVFNHGTISGVIDKADFDQEYILSLATSGVGGATDESKKL